MKNILIVAQFAPTFGGNFIESMKSLQEAEEISVRYLLPEQAKSGNLPAYGNKNVLEYAK